MTLADIAPHLAGLGFIAFVLIYAFSPPTPGAKVWMFPAALSTGFFAWTLYAVLAEGPLGFWTEHSRNLWGNQIWFDLLLAAGVGLTFLIPEARRSGMRPVPWAIAVICTGSIGLLAMMARVLFLRAQGGRASAPTG